MGYETMAKRMILQGIVTKYHGPTNSRGSRISATAAAGRVYLGYNHSLNAEDNHWAAANALADKLGWLAPGRATPSYKLAQGGAPNGEGYLFVLVRDNGEA
jgi:hypothetical protein